MVSGQLPPRKITPLVRVRVSLGLGAIFFWGSCPRTNWNVRIIRLEQLHESSVSFKTVWNDLNLCKIITKSLFESHYQVGNDDVKRHFVYFIVAICCNNWKSFLTLIWVRGNFTLVNGESCSLGILQHSVTFY